MFRRSNSGKSVFLHIETYSKDNAEKLNNFVNMEIATNFKVAKLG